MRKRWLGKRGQVAIFVIVAIVIVGIVLVIFLFPRLGILTGDVNPNAFLKSCIEQDLDEFIDVLSTHGGYSSPDNYILYQDEKIQYLCYTAESYKPCIVQQPLLVGHVENEIKNFIQPRARQCVEDLKNEYEKKGFDVRATPGTINVSIISESIVIDFLSPMTISKESTETFQRFAVRKESKWYNLLATATSIIDFESTYGDSETSLYIQYYPDLKIEKIKRDGGTTIYRLSNVVTKEEFTFATRSLVWPAGYLPE